MDNDFFVGLGLGLFFAVMTGLIVNIATERSIFSEIIDNKKICITASAKGIDFKKCFNFVEEK